MKIVVVKEPLFARLDRRTGKRILCNRVDCGLQLAILRADTVEEGSWDNKPAVLLSRWIEFPPGWVQHSDGTWRFSHYAVERVKQGKEPKVRSYPKLEEGFVVSREDYLNSVPELPADAICWQCGLLNRIDMTVLGIKEVALYRLLD